MAVWGELQIMVNHILAVALYNPVVLGISGDVNAIAVKSVI